METLEKRMETSQDPSPSLVAQAKSCINDSVYQLWNGKLSTNGYLKPTIYFQAILEFIFLNLFLGGSYE
jgi:hypothetical protein